MLSATSTTSFGLICIDDDVDDTAYYKDWSIPDPPSTHVRRKSAKEEWWTEERVALLTRLWDEGLSTSRIGKKLGVTKNSVMGKKNRLGLAPRRIPGQP